MKKSDPIHVVVQAQRRMVAITALAEAVKELAQALNSPAVGVLIKDNALTDCETGIKIDTQIPDVWEAMEEQ